MTIADSSETENPQVVMVLPVRGNNGAPLYAAMSFYSDQPINGKMKRKPHIVLTIAERAFFAEENHDGYIEVINNAVENNLVISYDKEKMRDYLSVIAGLTRVGNITEKSLANNIARFRNIVNRFKAKNHIDYKLAVREDTSAQALLPKVDEITVTPAQRNNLGKYLEQLEKVDAQKATLKQQRNILCSSASLMLCQFPSLRAAPFSTPLKTYLLTTRFT